MKKAQKYTACLGNHGDDLVIKTAARQVPLSMGFPRQESWSGLPFPSPGDFSHPEIKPKYPALQTDFFYGLSHQGSLIIKGMSVKMLRLDSPGKENPTKFLSSILT